MTEPLTDLLDACGRALTERSVASIADLQQVVRETGADLVERQLDGAEQFDLFLDGLGDFFTPLSDGRWTYLPALLDGRIWTHRLTPAEAADDLVELTPDLEPLDEASDPPRLSDGSPLEIGFDHPSTVGLSREVSAEVLSPGGTLILPVGALAGVGGAAGELVGFRTSTVGAELVAVEGPVAEGADLVAGLQRLVAEEAPFYLTTVLYTLIADLDTAFRRPTRPIAELIEAAGLARQGDLVAPPGFDFEAAAEASSGYQDERWAELSEDEIRLIETLGDLAGGFAEVLSREPEADRAEGSDELNALLSTTLSAQVGASGRTILDSLPLLDEPMVADLALTYLLGDEFHEAPVLVELLALLEPAAPRSARPPLRWMRARAYERLAELDRAEEHFRGAERLDPNWPLTLIDLARYAADRGDAVRALSLLARTEGDADPVWTATLRAQIPEPGPQLGRNEPCWCGSGRKFKQCHLNRPAVAPLADRVDWLQQKALHFVGEGPWRELRVELTVRWLSGTPESDHEARMADPLLDDLLLYEGGAIEDFLAVRGALLPADERELADRWLEVERSIFEVTAVRPDGGVDARDVRTQTEHVIAGPTGLPDARVGQLFCARVSPAGDTERLLGGVVVIAATDQEELIELLDARDPIALIDHFRVIAAG